MYEIIIRKDFEAAHSLRGDFGPASRLHGHTYAVEATFSGEHLNESGVLYDLGKLEQMLAEAAKPLHYKNLDDLQDFQQKNSTLENLCRYFYNRLAVQLKNTGLKRLKIRVWENPGVSASFESSLD